MPRQPRTELADGIHHVWQRGNNRRPIFLDVADRRLFLRLLREVAGTHEWIPLAYCLMNTHFHLVVETPVCSLGAGMRDLGSRYAQIFNERHEPAGGHLFQARFGSKLVRTDELYTRLFEPDGPLRDIPPDISPWELRPALAEILDDGDLERGVQTARNHGYRFAEIAAHLSVHRTTLWRRLQRTGSVPI